MGIFNGNISTGLSNDITKNDTFESLMESNIEELDCDDFEEGSMNSIVTMNENYNMIMTAIGIGEAVTFERTGKEFVWTEGTLSDFVGKIKSFLKKIWDKIKGLFKRAIAMFDSYNMQDKAFVKKYRKEIFNGKNLSDFKFKGYEFENLRTKQSNITGAIEACNVQSSEKITERVFGSNNSGGTTTPKYDRDNPSSLGFSDFAAGSATESDNEREKAAHKYGEGIDRVIEQVRGTILNKLDGKSTGEFTADEFRKEVKEWFHDGNTEKEELDKIEVGTLTNWLVGSKQTTKTLNDAFKGSKKAIDKDIKNIESFQKTHWGNQPLSKGEQETEDAFKTRQDKSGAYAAELSHVLQISRATKEMLMTIDGILVATLKECSRQYKACLVKIMHYNPKSESYNESYSGGDYSSYSGSNFLAGVELK